MPILKIKLTDAAGVALSGQTVNVSTMGELQSNADGIAQFLRGDVGPVNVNINGQLAWAGDSDELAKEETFQQGASGFARLG